ncbi:hypothetical protein HC725_09150 [Vibrio sp. S17_S38]|uniref:hypothetical protein n=1 Tax=Vibrio sp. S17_S38 TaxID=2720229 RepID=UPI0016816259|nr:hypothetical protein [Vibrio sp. S17_S38]MBD1573441.1 hypothetical protein [Vibrio sp. S17_S38]
MRDVDLTELGDTRPITKRLLSELVLKQLHHHRANFAQLYTINQDEIQIEPTECESVPEYSVTMTELGIGTVQVQVSVETLNVLFSKFMGFDTFIKSEIITQSHIKLFDKIIITLIDSLMSSEAENVTDIHDFKPHSTSSFSLQFGGIDCQFNICMDENYSDYLLDKFGYIKEFSSTEIHRLIQKINVETSVVLSEKQTHLQMVKDIQVGDTLSFSKKGWVSFQVESVEINKAKISTNEDQILSLTHSTSY